MKNTIIAVLLIMLPSAVLAQAEYQNPNAPPGNEYQLVCRADPLTLTQSVNQLVTAGWHLYGGQTQVTGQYCQGVIIEKSKLNRP